MAFLPQDATTLKGGCFCKAIRYTINIPSIENRQPVPEALPTAISHDHTCTVPTRFPVVSLDHCESCRRASGGIVQCWAMCPAEWINWRFLLRNNQNHKMVSNLKQHDEKSHINLSSLDAVTPQTPKQVAFKKSTSKPSMPPTAQTYITHVKTSPNTYRSFCGRCGTNLTSFFDRPESSPVPPIVDITVGSLDSESLEKIRPDRHSWWDDGTEWIKRLLQEGDGGVLIRHPTGRLDSAVDSWHEK